MSRDEALDEAASLLRDAKDSLAAGNTIRLAEKVGLAERWIDIARVLA